jgi:hypothetical protein
LKSPSSAPSEPAIAGDVKIYGRAALSSAAWAVALWLAACGNNLDWREFQSSEGRFSVAFPGKATHDKRTLTTPAGTVIMNMDSVSVGDALFGVGYADYPPAYLERMKTDAIVSSVRDALVRNIGGRNASEAPVARAGYQGRSLRAEGRSGERVLAMDALLVFAGGRFYQVVAIREPSQVRKEDVELYFNSFRIAE